MERNVINTSHTESILTGATALSTGYKAESFVYTKITLLITL